MNYTNFNENKNFENDENCEINKNFEKDKNLKKPASFEKPESFGKSENHEGFEEPENHVSFEKPESNKSEETFSKEEGAVLEDSQILSLNENFKKSGFFDEKFENLGSNSSNFAKVAGFVRGDLRRSHEIEGEKFYEFTVDVERLSKTSDAIPVTVSERILAQNFPTDGQFVEIVGEYRSYNKLVSEKSRLILHLFAKDVQVCPQPKQQVNEVKLVGFICKPPIYRRTPFEREICDVLLAINRTNNKKSDYIPCILWGRNARFVANQPVGSKVELTGRIQSRQYSKQLENGEKVEKTAYEVSCQSVSVLTNISSISAKSENAERAVNN